jgi:hypothetical protein
MRGLAVAYAIEEARPDYSVQLRDAARRHNPLWARLGSQTSAPTEQTPEQSIREELVSEACIYMCSLLLHF